jgi:hypothetical protein
VPSSRRSKSLLLTPVKGVDDMERRRWLELSLACRDVGVVGDAEEVELRGRVGDVIMTAGGAGTAEIAGGGDGCGGGDLGTMCSRL